MMTSPPRRLEALWEALRAAVGADAVRAPASPWEVAARPAAVVAPAEERDVVSLLRLAGEQRIPVVPVGGGTKQGWGGPPARDPILLSTERMASVVEHDPGNLTVTVQAGCRIADLQRALAASGQYLPVDAARPESATVGGVVATNANGPRRLLYGGLRDVLLGARTVLGDGEIINVGGKVVKNVAGYDLTKLLIGAFGSLAVITRCTFKLAPLPEARATFHVPVSDAAAGWALGRAIYDSVLLPRAVVLTADRGRFALTVAAEGFTEMVEAHRAWITRLTAERALGGVRETRDVEDEAYWRGLDEYLVSDDRVCLQISARPSRLPALFERLGELAKADWFADLAIGVVRVALPVAGVEDAVTRLRAATEDGGGHLVITAAPRPIAVSAWGSPRGDAGWIAKLKDESDPLGILNPGRLPGVP